MTLLKRLTFTNYALVIFLVFLAAHLFLFNVNYAEWGDSYRILRASQFLRNGSYPSDEKRPPLLSYLISLRPEAVDPITFGRFVVLLFSLATFLLVAIYVKKYIQQDSWRVWTLVAFAFNNVFLYWSIRVMADVPFAFFAVLALYLCSLWFEKGKTWYILLSGLVVGLAVLTRFEGYILGFSIGLGILIKNFKPDLKFLVKKMLPLVVFGAGAFVFVLPYILWKNPLTSSYFEEPAGRVYDLKMFLTFLVSLLSLFSFPFVFGLINKTRLKSAQVLWENPSILVFLLTELLLVLAWPAAVPRLFVCIIPFVVVVAGTVLENYFESSSRTKLLQIALLIGFTCIYILLQIYLKLQFLILDKNVFVINAFLQFLLIYLLVKRNKRLFIAISLTVTILWSAMIINMHRNIFISIVNAARYTSQNVSGVVAYNDVSSVSDWYLNNQSKQAKVRGFYYNTEKKENLDIAKLKNLHIDYLLITNEHNTTMTLDLNKRAYLKEDAVFEYVVNGKKFITRLIKVL